MGRVKDLALGRLVGQGTEVEVYELADDPTRVVKVPLERPDVERVLERRREGFRCLGRSGLDRHAVPTLFFVPGRAGGRFHPYVEVQPRLPSTLEDLTRSRLVEGGAVAALEVVQAFFDFEARTLWAHGLVMQDSGFVLDNVARHAGLIAVLDFCSISPDPLALEGLVGRGKASRRLRLTLERLGELTAGAVPEPEWSAFAEEFARRASEHYAPERMRECWARATRTPR